jgi:DnaJ-domain-containing protein 1
MTISKHEDPWRVLGVETQAGDEEIRQAYLRGVREHPPDRSPEEFERIRDAYDQLRDARRRAMVSLQSNPCDAPLENLLADFSETHRFLGPTPWLQLIQEKR